MAESTVAAAHSSPRVLCFATQGHGGNEEERILALLKGVSAELFPFNRSRKFRMFWQLLRTIRRGRPDLVVMEGTGLAGGAALIVSRVLFGQRYVVSSGDAVGPWVSTRVRVLGPVFGFYERILCRLASGFIGWTPYLVGRAMTFGAPRAMTAAGWAPFTRTPDEQASGRLRIRASLGIPPDNLVIGIAGSLVWSRRRGYCYGWELTEAALRVRRTDVTFLVVGEGTGLARMKARTASLPAGRVVFTGRVPQADLPGYYAAMDIGSLPQSVDRVGSFRYTTKLSEYLAFGLPIVTGQIPLAYDLDGGWLWRLPGQAPWAEEYIAALAMLIDGLSATELARKRAAIPTDPPEFRYSLQAARTEAFIRDLIKR
ncbi:MAG TPA: glycosyltransferase [Gemmata sp.]|nr:glycosyltransferase [Gemmata sp.]